MLFDVVCLMLLGCLLAVCLFWIFWSWLFLFGIMPKRTQREMRERDETSKEIYETPKKSGRRGYLAKKHALAKQGWSIHLHNSAANHSVDAMVREISSLWPELGCTIPLDMRQRSEPAQSWICIACVYTIHRIYCIHNIQHICLGTVQMCMWFLSPCLYLHLYHVYVHSNIEWTLGAVSCPELWGLEDRYAECMGNYWVTWLIKRRLGGWFRHVFARFEVGTMHIMMGQMPQFLKVKSLRCQSIATAPAHR